MDEFVKYLNDIGYVKNLEIACSVCNEICEKSEKEINDVVIYTLRESISTNLGGVFDKFTETVLEDVLAQIANKLNIHPKPLDDFNFSDRTMAMAAILKMMKDVEKEL